MRLLVKARHVVNPEVCHVLHPEPAIVQQVLLDICLNSFTSDCLAYDCKCCIGTTSLDI